MSLNMMSLNEKLSFFSLYLASSVYNLVKLTNSRSYPDVLIDWFTDESDVTNDRGVNDRDEIGEEYSWDRDRDDTNDEYSVDRL
jgi:hypothetical protein